MSQSGWKRSIMVQELYKCKFLYEKTLNVSSLKLCILGGGCSNMLYFKASFAVSWVYLTEL